MSNRRTRIALASHEDATGDLSLAPQRPNGKPGQAGRSSAYTNPTAYTYCQFTHMSYQPLSDYTVAAAITRLVSLTFAECRRYVTEVVWNDAGSSNVIVLNPFSYTCMAISMESTEPIKVRIRYRYAAELTPVCHDMSAISFCS
jgi:hypothetical protein